MSWSPCRSETRHQRAAPSGACGRVGVGIKSNLGFCLWLEVEQAGGEADASRMDSGDVVESLADAGGVVAQGRRWGLATQSTPTIECLNPDFRLWLEVGPVAGGAGMSGAVVGDAAEPSAASADAVAVWRSSFRVSWFHVHHLLLIIQTVMVQLETCWA
eukprot:8612483-Alexandrium_andersonii.AAC.1